MLPSFHTDSTAYGHGPIERNISRSISPSAQQSAHPKNPPPVDTKQAVAAYHQTATDSGSLDKNDPCPRR